MSVTLFLFVRVVVLSPVFYIIIYYGSDIKCVSFMYASCILYTMVRCVCTVVGIVKEFWWFSCLYVSVCLFRITLYLYVRCNYV